MHEHFDEGSQTRYRDVLTMSEDRPTLIGRCGDQQKKLEVEATGDHGAWLSWKIRERVNAQGKAVKTLATKQSVLIDEWISCYRGGWKGVIVDEAFSHPAKVAFNLAKRIYAHAIGEGWIERGQTVVDPFGGIGGCAFHGLMNGMIVVTNELEEKFVNLSKQNLELWRKQYTGLPGFDADNWIILQGDSRKLASSIREAGLSVSSPPYATLGQNQGTDNRRHEIFSNQKQANSANVWREGYGESPGQLGSMREGDLTLAVSSPPYANDTVNDRNGIDLDKIKKPGGHNSQSRKMSNYGASDGQLGRMTVSSPPFPQPYTSGGGINKTGYGDGSDKVGDRTYQSKGGDRVEGNLETMKDDGFDVATTSPPYNPPMSQDHNGTRGTEPSETGAFVKYGTSEGQIEGLSVEGFDAAISSPPYECTRTIPGDDESESARGYGSTTGKDRTLDAQDTFWSASRTILEQLYSVLTPGAHAIFITKRFVRDKKIVEFTDQWILLAEAVGFRLLHRHKAMLTETYGAQHTLAGEIEEDTVERKSFFRRLAEKKGSPRIDWEDVTCFVKPVVE